MDWDKAIKSTSKYRRYLWKREGNPLTHLNYIYNIEWELGDYIFIGKIGDKKIKYIYDRRNHYYQCVQFITKGKRVYREKIHWLEVLTDKYGYLTKMSPWLKELWIKFLISCLDDSKITSEKLQRILLANM